MLKMSFDSWKVETIKEIVLSLFMHTHASCMRAQPGFIRMHPLFMRMHLCSSVHYGHMLQHAYTCRTLRMHTRDLRTHIGTHKPHFLSNLIFFTHFSYPIIILMLFFILFCKSYHLSWVGIVLAIFLHGIGP